MAMQKGPLNPIESLARVYRGRADKSSRPKPSAKQGLSSEAKTTKPVRKAAPKPAVKQGRDYGTEADSLLNEWLERHECISNEEIARIFYEAGRLLPYRRSLRADITTRLLFFAIADLDQHATLEGEADLLSRASALFRKNAATYQDEHQAYFTSPAEAGPVPRSFPPLSMSSNVERLLEAAVARARQRESTVGVLEAADLLDVFPGESSKAKILMEALDISQDALGAVVRAKNERVTTHADEPADFDELGRQAFADILADRIREARESSVGDEPSAFIVHLHGPWGSGKSSVLNFLETNLAERPNPWIVVRFNAWRDQRLQPPWWRLITTIYSGARAQLGWRAPWLWLRWLMWRIRADYVPLIAVLLAAAILLALIWVTGSPFGRPTSNTGAASPAWFDSLVKLAPVAITLVGAIYLGSRALALGSRRAAQAYADLKDDPYRPIARLFNGLVAAIKRPVVVFIDDLDRCDSKYVVELLEGIQTLMRGAAVTYVVAADRKWICSSFEQRYAGFSPPIGECGRPLGYLFLDKLFQISAAIPQIPSDVRNTYWKRLLSSTPLDPNKQASTKKQEQAKAERAAAGLARQEDLQRLVTEAEASGDEIRIQAVRAACAKRITSPKAALHTEHRLQACARLLEPNPRAMKRLVNAYAMHQATLLLAGHEAAAGPLARWTILELRWPLLADFLATRPECLDCLANPLKEGELPYVPGGLRPLFGDTLVREVIGDASDEDHLNTEVVKSILGAVQGDR